MFELDPAAPAPAPPPVDSPAPPTPPAHRSPITPGRHLDLTSDLETTRRHISSYDPIYFAVGARERLNARFQFSFKYRVFEPGAPGEPFLEQLVRDFYAAYTQTSIWDLETFSKPFYDSSYKPTFFLLHEFRHDTTSDWLFHLQAGAQHESNGKGGGAAPSSPGTGLSTPGTALRHPSDSRSLNTLYIAAKSRWNGDSGLFIEAGARASSYFQIDENPDIARYRGYVELTMRGGYDRGFQLSVDVRGNPRSHGSVEFNATWPAIETPLLKLIFPRSLGGYAQIQYFNGYGESLLDYDVRRKDQLRFGLMIVR
jgi:outer membrane phospholipase A